jgi:hypothetical protein
LRHRKDPRNRCTLTHRVAEQRPGAGNVVGRHQHDQLLVLHQRLLGVHELAVHLAKLPPHDVAVLLVRVLAHPQLGVRQEDVVHWAFVQRLIAGPRDDALEVLRDLTLLPAQCKRAP